MVARVAVFDLDGTLTRADTLLPYLFGYLRGHPRHAYRLWRALAAVPAFAVGLTDRRTLKESFLRAFLAGAHEREVERWSERYVSRLIATGLHEQARAALERHRRDGYRLVLLSASPEIYVTEIARRLSFDETACTRMESRAGRLTGRIVGPNLRGPAKLAFLRTLRERYPAAYFVAYGNADSDIPVLEHVDRGYLVNASRRVRAIAAVSPRISALTWS